MSELIERFDFVFDHHADCYCNMEDCEDGYYVAYEAYTTLEAKIKELEAKLNHRDFQYEVLEETGKLLDESQDRIKDLEAKLNEVPSTIQEFVDRIEKLEDTIAEQRLRRKIEMTLKRMKHD